MVQEGLRVSLAGGSDRADAPYRFR